MDRIKHKYYSISLHVKIESKKRSLGEIDIVAKKGNKIDLYEVKCSHRILKAKKQLNKMVFGGNIEDASEILKKQQGLKRASLTIY